MLLLWGAAILGPPLTWLLFRRPGYKRRPLDRPPGPGWERTAERSIDPATEEVIEVYYHPRTGERAYVRALDRPL